MKPVILVVSMCSRRLSEYEFVDPVCRAIEEFKPGAKVVILHHKKLASAELSGASHIILTGNPLMDNEFSTADFSWLRDVKVPVLGICAGMQAIALAFGARLLKQEEIGLRKVKPRKASALLSRELDAYFLHGKGVGTGVSSLGLDILSSSGSKAYAVQARDSKLFGVIFHPEVRSQQIIGSFLAIG